MNYQKIHDSVIERAKNESRVYGQGDYYERHHIIPKCLGGRGKTHQWKTHPNIVLLTAREHFVIHQLLVIIHPEAAKLKAALWFMCNQKALGRSYRVSSRLYERARLEYIQQIEGIPKSEEHRRNLSNSKKGILRGPISDEHRQNLKQSVTGLKKSQEHRHNLSTAKSVSRFQYSLDGTFVKKWNSAKEAGSELGIDPGDISRCCKGTKKTAGGYLWSNKLEEINTRLHVHANASTIVQLTPNKEYVNTYPSINNASKAVGVSPGSISQCAQGLSKTGGGFIWIYEKDYLILGQK